MSMNNKIESVSLDEWISTHHNDEEMRVVFLNMDRALKYIHEHGYCIEVFHPSEIMVLENKPDHIQFNKLLELSSDFSIRRDMIREDIFNSSLIQIGFYTNSLWRLNPEFLKEHFDEFSQFIPAGDVPYYRGVVQRDASVYFCEYALEKNNRDLEALEAQLKEEGGLGDSKSLTKTSNHNIGVQSITNDSINDSIYKQINGLKDAAFVNLLIIPTITLAMILIIGLIVLFFSAF